jgi:hypothetical protein
MCRLMSSVRRHQSTSALTLNQASAAPAARERQAHGYGGQRGPISWAVSLAAAQRAVGVLREELVVKGHLAPGVPGAEPLYQQAEPGAADA